MNNLLEFLYSSLCRCSSSFFLASKNLGSFLASISYFDSFCFTTNSLLQKKLRNKNQIYQTKLIASLIIYNTIYTKQMNFANFQYIINWIGKDTYSSHLNLNCTMNLNSDDFREHKRIVSRWIKIFLLRETSFCHTCRPIDED